MPTHNVLPLRHPKTRRQNTQNGKRDAFLGVPQYGNLLLFSFF